MKRKQLIALHALVWLVLLLKDFLLELVDENSKNSLPDFTPLLIGASYSLVAMTAFYGSYWLIARFLIHNPKKIWQGITNILTVLLLTTTARFVVEFGLLKPILGFDNYANNAYFTWGWFAQNAILYYWSYVLYGLLYGFIENYFRRQQQERELLQSEIIFLRSQLNPHFLFNSLNDLYALMLTRPEQAPPALLKLSELMRYALYHTQTPVVPLADEVNYLKSYIELENIGQNGKACILTTFSGVDGNYYIAPMLLIPFVENALKHGVMHVPEHPVKIVVDVQSTELHFYCHNRKRAGNKDTTGGIGLANVRRRLELEYPNRYQLYIKNTENAFEVNLSLIL